MVLSGQMTREEALKELEKPLYDEKELEEDKFYVRKKLGLSEQEFEELLKAPIRKAGDFPSSVSFHKFIKKTQNLVEKILGKRVANYS